MKVLTAFFLFILPLLAGAQKNTPGNWPVPDKYIHKGPWAANGLAMVCKKNTEHCGCIDTMGKEVIPFEYGMNFFYFINELPQFNSVNRMVAAKPLTATNAVYGIINEKGETVLPFKYLTDYHNFHPLDPYHIFKTYTDPVVSQKQPNFYGVVDSLGTIILPFEYEKIEKAGENRFIVHKNNKATLFDNKGKAVLTPDFSKILYNAFFRVLFVEQDKLWGVYSLDGEEVLPVKHHSVNFMVDGSYLAAETRDSIKFFCLTGVFVIGFTLDYPRKRTDAKSQTTFPITLKHNKKEGVINNALKVIVPFEYDYLSFPYHLAPPFNLSPVMYHVKKDGKEAYIDTNNNLLCSMWFDVIASNGMVKKDGLWGWVNGQAKLIVPPKYETLKPILINNALKWDNGPHDYYLVVTQKGKTGLLDYNNKLLIPFGSAQEIHSVFRSEKDKPVYIIYKKGDKYGATDTKGNIIIRFEYEAVRTDFDSFMHFKFGHYLFTKGKKMYLVDWDNLKIEETMDY